MAARRQYRTSEKMPATSYSSDEDNVRHGTSVKFRGFGRGDILHKLPGGEKLADVLLWKDKKKSAVSLSMATLMWVLLECMEYHVLTLICHFLMLSMIGVFFWTNGAGFVKRSPPHIPEITFSEEVFHNAASAVRTEANRLSETLYVAATGKDLKTFLMVLGSLWIVSVVSSWCNFATLVYSVVVAGHTVPILYIKYQDRMDSIALRAGEEMQKHYTTFDDKVLSKIPRRSVKPKRKK